MWVSRRCVRKTYCQDDIWSGWPAALGHLSGLCLPGQIVARPTPVYTRIFSYYFSSNLFVVRLAKKVKYGIRKGFCRPSHPYFDKMCFFSEIEKCLRTAVYKESVIFYGIYPQIPSYTIIYPHIPSYTLIYHHIPSYTLIYTHIPSYTLIYPHIPSYTLICTSHTLIYPHILSYTICCQKVGTGTKCRA